MDEIYNITVPNDMPQAVTIFHATMNLQKYHRSYQLFHDRTGSHILYLTIDRGTL
jgi:hypothetical protein